MHVSFALCRTFMYEIFMCSHKDYLQQIINGFSCSCTRHLCLCTIISLLFFSPLIWLFYDCFLIILLWLITLTSFLVLLPSNYTFMKSHAIHINFRVKSSCSHVQLRYACSIFPDGVLHSFLSNTHQSIKYKGILFTVS